MGNVLLVELATILLAVFTALQRIYQKQTGTAPATGLAYNALLGLFAAVLFWAMCGFKFEFTPYSAAIAAGEALLAIAYTLLGFCVMREGGMVLYTLFLMVGGMMVPYVWGLLFLGEPFALLRTLGLVLILGAVILFNSGSQKPSAKVLWMCAAVFFLNGGVSVLSKLHQIETVRPVVSTEGLVMLVNLSKAVLSAAALLFVARGPALKQSLPRRGLLLLVAGCSLFGGLSYQLQLMGASNLPATLLYPLITGGSILFSALLDGVWFKEMLSRRGWAGVILCVVGTILML